MKIARIYIHLHSTVVLLKVLKSYNSYDNIAHLHSTVVLLKVHTCNS